MIALTVKNETPHLLSWHLRHATDEDETDAAVVLVITLEDETERWTSEERDRLIRENATLRAEVESLGQQVRDAADVRRRLNEIERNARGLETLAGVVRADAARALEESK